MAILISTVVFVVSFINGPLVLHNGAPLGVESAAWCLVALISFSVIVTKATSPRSPEDIFKGRRF